MLARCPFFQATSAKLPLDREVVNVRSMADLPSAGPYAFTLNDVNRLTSLRRNPYWTRGPGRTAPRHLNGVDLLRAGTSTSRSAFEMVKANQLDQGPIPSAEVQSVASQYGVNRSRFWVTPTNSCLGQIALNNSRGLFHDNVQMRKAVNWALDRTDVRRPRLVRPDSPWNAPAAPRVPGLDHEATASALCADGERSRRRGGSRGGSLQGRQDHGLLPLLGLDRTRLRPRSSGAALIIHRVRPRQHHDEGLYGRRHLRHVREARAATSTWAVSLGWCPVPTYSLIASPFLPGRSSRHAKYREQESRPRCRLKGNARAAALGKLDLEIMRNVAPVAVTNIYNNRYFFSDRVRPRSLVSTRAGSTRTWSTAALEVK